MKERKQNTLKYTSIKETHRKDKHNFKFSHCYIN
jgi:hypothetical protein